MNKMIPVILLFSMSFAQAGFDGYAANNVVAALKRHNKIKEASTCIKLLEFCNKNKCTPEVQDSLKHCHKVIEKFGKKPRKSTAFVDACYPVEAAESSY